MAKSSTNLCLVNLSSDIPLVEASGDQESYIAGQLDILSAFESG